MSASLVNNIAAPRVGRKALALNRARVAVRPSARPVIQCGATTPDSYVPPSSGVAKTELDCYQEFTTIVPDTVVLDAFNKTPPKAAIVTSSLLLGIEAASGTEPQLKAEMEYALAYPVCEKCGDEHEKFCCFIDKAMANVGTGLLGKIVDDGALSVEVDPRDAKVTSELVRRARRLSDFFKENGAAPSRLLLKIPATWEGIQAVKVLEKEGIQCHVTQVFSTVQAAAAAQAGATVIQPYVGRVRDWVKSHPNFIHDPKGPREDSGLGMGEFGEQRDFGLQLVKNTYNYVHKYGHKSQVMAASVRNKQDVLNLCGIDYVVCPQKVMTELDQTDSLAGYNDGLRGGGGVEDDGVVPQMTIAGAQAAAFDEDLAAPITEGYFRENLGQMAEELLEASLGRGISAMDSLEERIDSIYPLPQM